MGFPIRISTDQRLLAAPRGFSQRATSFIASWCQGIHRMPFSCLRSGTLFRVPQKPTLHTSHSEERFAAGRPRTQHTWGALAWRPDAPEHHRTLTVLRPSVRQTCVVAPRSAPEPDSHVQRSNRTARSPLGQRAETFFPLRHHEPVSTTLVRGWWRRSGSNRRPPACKAGALPAELRPRPIHGTNVSRRNPEVPGAGSRMVGQGGFEPPTPRLSSVCSNQLSY